MTCPNDYESRAPALLRNLTGFYDLKWILSEFKQDLSNIVKVRRQGIYYCYHQIDWQVWLCSGYMVEAREEEDVQVRPGDRHSRKIYMS